MTLHSHILTEEPLLYGDAAWALGNAVRKFKTDVESRSYPADDECYHLPASLRRNNSACERRRHVTNPRNWALVKETSMVEQIELHFLGSGDAFGSGGRFQTCLYVHGLGDGFLIDCGASSLIALKRNRIDPSKIHWILLSHLHGDHFGGLPFLILDGQFSRRTMPLVIAGPPGVAARVEAAMEIFFPGSSTVARRFPLEFVELAERAPTPVGPTNVTAHAVCHPSGSPSYALRVQLGEKVISYSGDTEWTDNLVDLAADADVFVCEGYFFEKKIPYHLDYATLLKHRSKLDCRRLIMTHMSEDLLHRLDEAKIEAAKDGSIVAL